MTCPEKGRSSLSRRKIWRAMAWRKNLGNVGEEDAEEADPSFRLCDFAGERKTYLPDGRNAETFAPHRSCCTETCLDFRRKPGSSPPVGPANWSGCPLCSSSSPGTEECNRAPVLSSNVIWVTIRERKLIQSFYWPSPPNRTSSCRRSTLRRSFLDLDHRFYRLSRDRLIFNAIQATIRKSTWKIKRKKLLVSKGVSEPPVQHWTVSRLLSKRNTLPLSYFSKQGAFDRDRADVETRFSCQSKLRSTIRGIQARRGFHRVTKSTRYTDVWPRFNEEIHGRRPLNCRKTRETGVYRRDANPRELINAFAIPILKTVEFDVFATSRLARHGIICHKTNEIVSDVDVKYNATEDESS